MLIQPGLSFHDHLHKWTKEGFNFNGETKLEIMSQNEAIDQDTIEKISTFMKKFNNIQSINFTCFSTDLQQDDVEKLITSMEGFDQIKRVHIEFGMSSLTDKSFGNLIKILNKNAEKIESIAFIDQFTSISSNSIPNFVNLIKKCKDLKFFTLQLNSSKDLHTKDISQICESVSTATTRLTKFKLNVEEMGLTDEFLPHIAKIIKVNPNLRFFGLEMRSNQCTQKGITQVIDELALNKEIKQVTLELKNNKFDHVTIVQGRLQNQHYKLFKTQVSTEEIQESKKNNRDCRCSIF